MTGNGIGVLIFSSVWLWLCDWMGFRTTFAAIGEAVAKSCLR